MGQVTALLTQLGVNYTVFIMFGIFTVTYLIVSHLLTKPVGELLIERDNRTTGRQEEISKIRVELTDITEQLAAERRKAQSLASFKFSELRAQAVSEQRKILAEAREDFSSKVKATREKAERAMSEERQKLDRATSDLKEEMVSKLLGTTGSQKPTLRGEV